MSTHIEGLIAAPYTPMNADGTVNLDMVGPMAEFLHRNGVRGGFICGSTGEGVSLTVEERVALTERWVADAPKGFQVIVHIGHTSIEACKTLARHSEQAGAVATGAMAPYFFRPGSVEGLVDFCAEIAAAQELPFFFYHIPSMTHVDFPMIEFLEVAHGRIPNLAGIKFTSEDLMDFELCRAFDGGRYCMLFGRDEILLAGLALGCRGAIGSSYNFAAPLYNRIIEAFDAGDLETARALQRKSMEMIRFLAGTGSYHSAAKALMGTLGVECGPNRLPVPTFTPEQSEAVRAGLEELGFFEYCCR